MKKSVSIGTLIIPVVSGVAAIALIVLALMPRPESPEGSAPRAVMDGRRGGPPALDQAAPVPAPRPQ